MRALWTISCATLGVLCLAGCGKGRDGLIRANGVLTWEHDGSPIAQAQVTFHPEGGVGKPASGFTGKDGTFDLTTSNAGDGIAPGKYKIVVVKRDLSKIGAGPEGPPQDADLTKLMKEFASKGGKLVPPEKKSLLPEIYASAAQTPLNWTIEPGGGRIELKIKKF